MDVYLRSGGNDWVCLLFGLRRTGKNTMLRQTVLDKSLEDAERTAYINATVLDTVAALNRERKTALSVTMNPPGTILTPPSARRSSTPLPVTMTEDTSGICVHSMRSGN